MLEYFAYKKYKKHKKEKDEERSRSRSKEKGKDKDKPEDARQADEEAPVLDDDDESFLESILSDDAPPPALPPRIKTPEVTWDSDAESRLSSEVPVRAKTGEKGKDKDKDDKNRRFSLHFLSTMLDKAHHKDKKASLEPNAAVPTEDEVAREERDITRVLNRLNLSARNNRAVSLSSESGELAKRFNLVLRDLVRGVPTAVHDLQKLMEDRDGLIERTYERLPSSMQKLVEKMPEKLTGSLAPELLAAVAESQGKKVDKEASLGDAALNFLSPKNITELVTKPGAVVGMLRAIVNALKLRWPAFIGTNVIWSVAVFLLLFVLWYCYKRGREERLKDEHEQVGKQKKDDDLEVEDVTDKPDGPLLPEPHPVPIIAEPGDEARASGSDLPPPPMGKSSQRS